MSLPPLYIYIIRHAQSKHESELLIETLYSTFVRDIKDPFKRNIGIPVFSMLYENKDNAVQIDCSVAERIVVIPLIDDNAVCDDDFIEYLNLQFENIKSYPKHLFIPVALSPNALNVDSKFSAINAIRQFDLGPDNNYVKLKISLLHEISRHIYDLQRTGLSNEPLQIFLSHAKADGVNLTQKIRTFFCSLTGAKTFFDVNDIAPGFSFGNEIIGQIKKSILLVNYTDSYSSREWCRKEILEGKKARVPILIINSLKRYEARNFPYAGNAPVIKWNDSVAEDLMLCEIGFELMYQTLLFEFTRLNTYYILQLYNKDKKSFNVISQPPELLSITHFDKSKSIVLYPDPPLSNEELVLFDEIGAKYQFVTPLLIPLLGNVSDNNFLKDIKIGISISEAQDIETYGFSKYHLRDALIEFSRYILACGGTIVYGGDVRYGKEFNFAQILKDIIENYNSNYNDKALHIVNYCGYPISKKIAQSDKASLKKHVKFELLERAIGLNDIDHSTEELDKFTDVKHQFGWAKCMTEMRESMNRFIDARIIMGGKTYDYKGKMPGIIEEAYMCLRDKKPLYILGAFGGAGKVLKEALLGEKPEELTSAFQSVYSTFPEFETYYNERVNDEDKINYDHLVNFFNNAGLKSLNNGLSEAENIELLDCVDIHKAVSMVLKGLNGIQNKRAGVLNT